ncbi:uncharacterized protein E5676_scaffold2406G00230 [Cucumis melo var. makuwa]|uniref:Transposase-associated domain-containing protein n=1 Tax=Cucumis melo var. makuwa TaxID=1194695 RepID=A0A5D3E061_CUCMM|nr:uncharacterized protein E5676_scaffold2406G00230 [Cucumis melo var. makuwa]
MNKDWIKLRDRFSKEYIDGVVQFVEAAKHHVNREGQTRCPWKNSHNAMFQTLASLVDHGLVDDILREQPTTENDDNELFKLLNDLQGPMKEGAYGEDEKDFRNEMHENTRQWNVRLALALDAYNPFENMSNAYSMWLVVLIPYNFPPLKCMMKSKFFMSFLIPGSKSPEKEIDVHLKSLIEELKELWNDGVRTYDYMSNKFFQLRTCLLWTINDFPTYGDLLRWSTKGYQACPTCKEDRSSFKRGKISFIGHRRYLPSNHSWHKSKQHDGKLEHRPPPIVTNGDEILKQVTSLNFPKLNVMDIEKNICDRLLWTLMNIDGKTKDMINAHLDLENLNIRKDLHLRKEGTKFVKPLDMLSRFAPDVIRDEAARTEKFVRGLGLDI